MGETSKVNDQASDPVINLTERRTVLKYVAMGSGTALTGGLIDNAFAQTQTADSVMEKSMRGMTMPRIKDINVIEMASGSFGNFVLVKVTTDQAGLYGYGEASVEYGSKVIKVAVEQYLKPLVLDRTIDRVEDIWQLCYLSSYYKNDYLMNTAISGICDALWDIKGRLVGMPVHQLVGGKVRDAAEIYMHVSALKGDPTAFIDGSKKLIAQGVRNILLTMSPQGGAVQTLDGKAGFDPDAMDVNVLRVFEAFRKEIPDGIRLGLDVGSKLDGARAVQFCKDANQFKPLLWVEDVVSPEDQMQLRLVRQQCATPLSFGELWNNPHEWRPIIEERLVDYIRPHISHIGGFTAALKLAAFAAPFGVKTGWHAIPITPVGQMARTTLDVVCDNFGFHEHIPHSDQIMEIFSGSLEIKNGYAWVSDKPGWGVEIDEAKAAKLPPGPERSRELRRRDGTLVG